MQKKSSLLKKSVIVLRVSLRDKKRLIQMAKVERRSLSGFLVFVALSFSRKD